MAREMKDSLLSVTEYEGLIVTNVPRRKEGIKKYGFDHAAALARSVAKLLNVPYIPTLVSHAKTAQKGLRGRDRKINAQFSAKRSLSLKGKTVLLIDDVVTTGSSMGNAAMVLKGEGAKTILGACFAIAYHDPYVSFDS